MCYFATKSIDEFLSLQQTANMEVIGAIHACGAELALPTSLMRVDGSLTADPVGTGAGMSAPSTTTVGGESVVSPYDKVVGDFSSGGHVDHVPGSAASSSSAAGAASSTQSDLADEMELAETLSDY